MNELLKKMCESWVDAVNLDSYEAGVDLPALTKLIPKNVVVIGNICSTGSILNGNSNDVKESIKRYEFVSKFYIQYKL